MFFEQKKYKIIEASLNNNINLNYDHFFGLNLYNNNVNVNCC